MSPQTSAAAAAAATNQHPDRLLVACQKGDLETVRQLVTAEGISVNHANVIRQSALHICAWWARLECMTFLLDHGATVQVHNTMTGATPLHCSLQSSKAALMKSQRLGCIRLLLKHGADPQAVDMSGRTPLEYLEEDDIDRPEILAILQDSVQVPPLFTAIAERQLETFEALLIDNEAQLSTKYKDETPLLRLVREWCDSENGTTDDKDGVFFKQATSVLLNTAETETSSNDPSWMGATNAEGHTAMDILCQAIVHRFKILQSIHEDATISEWCQVVTRLVASTTCTVPLYTTATSLQWIEIARRNMLELAQKFEQWKIVIEANRQGMTPLHFAARSGHVDMARFLMEQNPRLVRQTDQRGQTPLQAAQANGHTGMVELLQDYDGLPSSS